MARRIPPSKSTSRKLGKKSPKFLIIAFCEGKNTEPEYIESFAKHHGNGLVKVEPVPAAGVPLTIVVKAVNRKRELDAKPKDNSFDGLYEVWAVFDIDEHPNIPRAVDMATANHVYTAISNPCIEIWALWHFTFHQSYIHRHDLQRELAKYMTSYQSDSSKLIDYELIRNNYTEAKTRAEKQLANHKATGNSYSNPSTTFHKLLEKIIENGISAKTTVSNR